MKKTKVATKSTQVAAPTVTRSKAARANISEGTRLYALAGRPTKAQFVKVYGRVAEPLIWNLGCPVLDVFQGRCATRGVVGRGFSRDISRRVSGAFKPLSLAGSCPVFVEYSNSTC